METIILSVGGSLIVPDEIDVEFLRELKSTLGKFSQYKFVIAPGGGKTARKYGNALAALGNTESDDADWLGIYSIRINALLLKSAFKDLENVFVIEDPKAKPGQTSDSHAVEYAQEHDAKVVINLSNIDYVYDKNPNEFKDAEPLKNVAWADFLNIVGGKWEANKSWPFDPVASKVASDLGLKVVFMNGKPLGHLEDYLGGKDFVGTVIS